MGPSLNVVSMLGHCLRRWPNIGTALSECPVFSGNLPVYIRHVTYYDPMVFKCWPAVSDVGPTLKQHCVNVAFLLGTALGINSRPNRATLIKCWASVVDGVPAMKQHWLHVIVQRCACLPGQSVPEAYATTLSWHKETLNQCWFNVCPLSTTLD